MTPPFAKTVRKGGATTAKTSRLQAGFRAAIMNRPSDGPEGVRYRWRASQVSRPASTRNAPMPSWASAASAFIDITSYAYAYALGWSRSICV